MIQRIQTLFLALAALFSSLLFLGIAKYTTTDKIVVLNAMGVFEKPISETVTTYTKVQDINYGFLIALFVVANSILTIVCIFMYHNRKLQIRLCDVALINTILLILTIANFHTKLLDMYGVAFDLKNFKMIFPFLALMSINLAKRYIKKDDDLVKSADRIR